MKRIKLLLTRILPCLLVIACVFTVISCKPSSTKTYPSVSPTISDPEGTFMTIGSHKVTKKAVYDRLVQNYGLDALKDLINEKIVENETYDSHYSDEDFEKNLEIIIYGADENDSEKSNKANLTAEEQKEALETFEEKMRASGFFTEAEYRAYYKLSYQTMNYVVKQFKKFVEDYNNNEENKDPYFSEADMKNYYETYNRPKVEAIIITFDSEYQALQEMSNLNIDIKNLNGTWKIDGQDATPESLRAVFEKLYKAVYGKDYVSRFYTAKDLNKISGTIYSKAYKLEVLNTEKTNMNKSYTHAPLTYGSRYYVMLKLSEDASGITSYEDYSKDDIIHGLVENTINEYYIDKIFGEKYMDMKLKIYDEGLETKYVSEYKAAFSNLNITDYPAFATTTEESASNVVSFTLNGKEVVITADELYTKLINQYGPAISLSLLQQHVLLSNREYNNVVDYETGKILDQNKYDEYYKADVQQFKTAFEEGKYASSGYPASYGWEHFIHDYLGVNSELEIMTSMDSSLVDAAKDILGKTMWTNKKTVHNDETGKDEEVTADDAVQAEMEKIFNEFFSVSVIGVYVFRDADEDGIADHYAEGVDTDPKSEELLNKIYAAAQTKQTENKVLNKTLETSLSEIVTEYKLASTSHAVWGEYKALGLKVTTISSTNYTNSSSINETLKNELQALWKKGYNIDEQKITGKSLDPGYRYTTTEDSVDTVHYVTASDLTSGVFFINNTTDENKTPNVAYKVSVTKVVDHTYITGKVYKPTLADYEKYLNDNSSVSSSMKTGITTYYIPAITNILSINGVTEAKVVNAILEACQAKLAETTWASNGEQIKARMQLLIDDSFNEVK
ncbi:MAG: hypothetical protein SOZ32_00115 [Bacilli bacterium]|nr:hypothetical protein [Bacilli bacterium]